MQGSIVNLRFVSFRASFSCDYAGIWWDAGDATDVNTAVISGSDGNADDKGTKFIATGKPKNLKKATFTAFTYFNQCTILHSLGDDSGNVTLYKFPCLGRKPAYKR